MSEDIKELVERLKEESPRLSDGSNKIAQPYQWAIDALEAMAGEVADALPWKLFYKDGLDLEQIGKRLGKSPYEFSPWLYAPLISQLKDREQTALADLSAERDRLAGEVERLKMLSVGTALETVAQKERAQKAEAERDRLKAALKLWQSAWATGRNEPMAIAANATKIALGGDAS